ncbi:MAG: FAD-dependent oxidoreductase [Ruminococcaceae bacterium]|nr:FAD-dependent oxidoreductase [Oscillospiraceae bacterium]
MESIWNKNINRPHLEALKGDIKTDVLIIGGGIAGILCAYMLRKKGIDCILVEAEHICGGVTQNTTAKITYQHGLEFDKLICKFGEEKTKLYLKSQIEALREFEKLCKNIDCDYETKSSYVYLLENPWLIEKELKALEKLGVNGLYAKELDVPLKILGAVGVGNQAEFNPLKFCFSLAKELPIYENTKVLELKPNFAKTENGRILAQKTIVATHFPFINKHGLYPLKMYQHRSYVIALENAQRVDGMYVDEDLKGMSFRMYGDKLLLGGGSHRTGKTGGSWAELEEFAKKNYPSAKIVSKWATQDCMTLDGLPYIGQYSKNTPNLYVATGFNKWGMTSSMVAAKLLTDLILGNESEYSSVYSPSRSMLTPQLVINVSESLKGILTPTAPRCSHLGCALKYNPQERSWDCSCHGSRFSENGKVIDNPATTDKNF